MNELKKLRREERAPSIPECNSPHFNISVRHPHLGIQSRSFTPGTKMLGVYDWIGPLSAFPEHFALVKVFPRETVYPEEDIFKCASTTLCMISQDAPIPLSSDDDEVQLYCGDNEVALDTTDVDYPSTIPDQLMEDDKAPSQAENCAAELRKRRQNFIDEQQNKNTLSKTKRDIELLKTFLQSQKESRDIENIPKAELDDYLSSFLVQVRKKDGEEYEPSSLRSFISSFDRYLKKKDYGTSIMEGSERDPIHVYDLYASKRPEEMNNPGSPFYLATNHTKIAASSKPWFKIAPMGENKLNAIMKTMADKAGLDSFLARSFYDANNS
ncbi:hypothetical protein AC249_AIPGENE22936 [Exaiptasia diaphana]|nr:hypothetical protein AC249_AIPGENE22936 [Exaiptasia diaphana]